MSRTVVLPAHVEGRSLRRLRRELLAHLRTRPVLVVDASAVTHLSDAGQAVLITVHRATAARGGRQRFHAKPLCPLGSRGPSAAA